MPYHPTHPVEVHQVLPTTTGPALPQGQPGTTYDRLVVERLHGGLLMADMLGHPFQQTVEQHQRVTTEPLEARLDRFRRWRGEHAELVRQAEDARLHEPGSPPAPTPWPCLLCLRESDDLDLPSETRELPWPRFARSPITGPGTTPTPTPQAG